VGSGISGLSAAWHLKQFGLKPVLFEAGAHFGGHANTVDVTLDGITHGVDTGFLVYNERTYPGLIGLFEALGVGDVVSKSLGTSNPYNMVRATFDALKNQQSPRMVAQRRGRSVSEILARREDQSADASA